MVCPVPLNDPPDGLVRLHVYVPPLFHPLIDSVVPGDTGDVPVIEIPTLSVTATEAVAVGYVESVTVIVSVLPVAAGAT
jgi:hypothetical protein